MYQSPVWSHVELLILRLTKVPGLIKTFLLKDLEVAPGVVDFLLEPVMTLSFESKLK